MDDNTQQPQDDQPVQQDDNGADGVLDAIKNVIPGDTDDQLIDKASSAMDGMGDKANEWTEKATDAIPGTLDDKLVDGVQSAGDKAGDLMDKLKDMNPFDKSDDENNQQ